MENVNKYFYLIWASCLMWFSPQRISAQLFRLTPTSNVMATHKQWFSKNQFIKRDKNIPANLLGYILDPREVTKVDVLPLFLATDRGNKVFGKCLTPTLCFTAFNDGWTRESYIITTNLRSRQRHYIAIIGKITDFYIYETPNHFLLIVKNIFENGEFAEDIYALNKSMFHINSLLHVIRDTKDASPIVWNGERIRSYLSIKTENLKTYFVITSGKEKIYINFNDVDSTMALRDPTIDKVYFQIMNNNIEHQKSFRF